MKLLIVESPNKIKKLKSFLGSGWEVAASVGHIRDLPAKELGIDRTNHYQMSYQIYEQKKQVVNNLRAKVAQVGKENVYLATDPDREGEAISFHLCIALGLDWKTTHRVTFQEITQTAVQNALIASRTIDMHLVAAQESRRAIDRLVGYEVSPLLWRKLESGMSAGRVQSVAVRLCVERERAIAAFGQTSEFVVSGVFLTPQKETFTAKRLERFLTEAQAQAYLQSVPGGPFQVSQIEKKRVQQSPSPPFSTSTLQQEASKKFKWNVKKVMDVAQKLFEGGHITYMRTDSLNLSEEAIQGAQTHILVHYGNSYFHRRQFKSKSGAQEAHEAIRPTHWELADAGESDEETALYQLIWKRAIASQMAAAEYDQTTLTLDRMPAANDFYQARGKVLVFDGFLKVYQLEEEPEEESEQQTLPLLEQGQTLQVLRLEAKQTFKPMPKRFTEATLVAELEKRAIGRPSTYASILSTILSRGYVQIGSITGKKRTAILLKLEDGQIERQQKTETYGADKAKLLPTEKGNKVTSFLEEHFRQIIDYDFTAACEESFDQIVEKKTSFLTIVSGFDQQLQQLLSSAESLANVTKKESSLIELGRYQNELVQVGKSQYGTFIRYQNAFYPVADKTLEPAQLTLEIAIATILTPVASKTNLLVRTIGKFEIRRKKDDSSKFYVTKGDDYAPLKIVEDQIDSLTETDCKQAITSFKKWKKTN